MSTAFYACANRVLARGYFAPERKWKGEDFEIEAKWIENTMSQECHYSKEKADPRCGDCRHKQQATEGRQPAISVQEQFLQVSSE